MRLSDAQIELYSRQILLREIGGIGQRKLLDASCLVRGSGAAAETALSYLAGAGIGAIDLAPARVAGAPALPLATLAARCSDTVLRAVTGAAAAAGAYDVVLTFCGAADDLGRDALPRQRARVGEVAVHGAVDGSISVRIVPHTAGCLACVAAAGAVGDGGQPADPAARGAAGALAALACCRWLLDIAGDAEARVLRLAAGSGLWFEGIAVRAAPCPRGCPPRDERL